MKRLVLLLLGTGVIAALLTGCTTVQKGAAVGGTAGAAVGGIWAHNGGVLSTAEGALVGAATGGLVGALIGDQLEDKVDENLEAEIENLRTQIAQLEKDLEKARALEGKTGEKDQIIEGLKRLTDKLNSDLADLKRQLENKENELAQIQKLKQQQESNLDELKKQLDDLEVQLAQTPKGLTLTMVESLLFKPGLADISDKGKELLDNVAVILKEQFPNRELIIEGHTDNQPIKLSGWKSNWELGAARSLSVLHYLVDNHDFDPRLVSAASYGMYRPVSMNDTEENRGQNRRAVIVVPPVVDVIHKSMID